MMKIPTWFFEKISNEAKRYGMYIDYESNTSIGEGAQEVEVSGSMIKESEKAVYVDLNTGAFGGSTSGFKTWIPKSLIKA